MKMAAAQTLRVWVSITPQGSCSRKPPRRARSPALHCGRKRAVSHKTLPPAGSGGPMQSIGPYAGEMAVCRSPVPPPVCLVLPGGCSCPPGKVCESGNIAVFGRHYSARLLQPQAPRRARSPALHCGRKRAVSHKTLPPARPGGPMQSIGPYAGSVVPRKDTCKARRRTPPSADADSSPCRGAFQAPKGSPARVCRVERPDGLLPPCPAARPLSPKHSPPSL